MNVILFFYPSSNDIVFDSALQNLSAKSKHI